MNGSHRSHLLERIVQIASAFDKIIQKFPFQGGGQSRGAESPKGGSVSTRKTDRFHDLILLSSD